MKSPTSYNRFRARSAEERRILLQTSALFMIAHALLWVTSVRRTRNILIRITRGLNIRVREASQLTWVINAVTKNTPGRHSCLVQAVCCEAIAVHSGLEAEFVLGAARGPTGMRFHAWVEHAGHIIAGEHHGEFTPLR